MRPGKRERALIREIGRQKQAQRERASLVLDLPGRARTSLDGAFKGDVVAASKPKWDYLPKRVNGMARHSKGRSLYQV